MTDPVDPADTGQRSSPVRRPRRLLAFLIGVVLAGMLAVVLFVGLGTTSKSGSGTGGVVAVGAAAPNFDLPAVLGGPTVVLDALGVRRNRPVILNFFASWCTPCRAETPLLASTAEAQKAAGSDIQFVGVDAADPKANAVPFIKQAGITYPVGGDADLQVTAGAYGLNAEPNTFFIDRSGVVLGHVIGPVDKTQLDHWIHRLTSAD